MKTLLVINDNTPQADHAAKFALMLAQGLNANILIANACVKSNKAEKALAGAENNDEPTGYCESDIKSFLIKLNQDHKGFKPEIVEIDISAMNETQLTEFTIKEQIWMMVKGMTDHSAETLSKVRFNINTLMNKVRCPLLIVPFQWSLKPIERLVYIADLRYCRIQFVRFLAELAKPWSALVSIANLSAKGLPNMCESYANDVFNDEICTNVNYDGLLLNNIKEPDLKRAVDVIINGLHNDVLVMVNHRFHFKEIVGDYITEELPENITIPLLVFPY